MNSAPLKLSLLISALACSLLQTPAAESAAARDQRMAWFRDARFGMFIHWGLYSVAAGEWDGKSVPSAGEWIMQNGKIPVSAYEKLVPQFNPVKFNAREWVRIAKNAGMKYIVITSKHHDGFGLWNSQLTDWCVKSTPFHRDPLKELAAACKEEGITLCFYHSIMDWHHPDYTPRRPWNDVAKDEPNFDRYADYMKGELKELLTNYGPLGILWFDGEWENTWTHERGVDLYNYVRGLQPKIIVNNRVGKARAGMSGMDQGQERIGDYGTPEQEIPATGFGPGVDWESCMTMNNTWGFRKDDQNWKSSQVLIRNLVDCASKGGNYLLNVGPTGEGLIPEASVERLAEVGEWMKLNGESIYGTHASPFDKLAWGRCTQKAISGSKTRLYLHVFDWPTDGKLELTGLANKPLKASLLANGKTLAVASSQNRVSIILPADAPDKNASVIALDIQGKPEIVKADPYADETPAQRDARMKWFREARFGMFIHWGVYSVPAGTYNGKQIQGIGEWIMNRGKIPVAEYRDYAKQFNPVKFNADEWVRTAKDAGMKYIVITSKHHDGFAMFDSRASDWNIVKGSPFGRDPLKELAAACKKQGVKLGFYYSQAQDWNNGGSASGGKWDKAQDRSMDEYIDQVAAPQVKEILTHYGEFPAILWWDTPTDMNKERAEKLISLLKLKPGIIHNNRLGGGFKGDTETPEQFIPATGYPGRDWETCMTMNNTWGFKSYDHNWKSTETLIRNLVDIASKGGNYLLNVGPTSEGLIPDPSVERLKEIGNWMKVNHEAIYDTTANPFKRLSWGRCTKKLTAGGATLYLHVFNWPRDGKLLVPGLKNQVVFARLLADGTSIPASASAEGVSLQVPAQAPDPISSTVVLNIKGPIDIGPGPGIIQDFDGSVALLASEARLHGNTIQYEGGEQHDNLGYWTNAKDWADWEITVTKPGTFDVTAEMAALASTSIEIAIGDEKIKATSQATGDYGRYRIARPGQLNITTPGRVTLTVRPVAEGWQPLNLRAIRLKPAANQ